MRTPAARARRDDGGQRFKDVAWRWFGILSVFLSAQGLTRLVGIGAGLLLVNFMPVEQYALYTLAMSVVAFFTFATDLGASSSLTYFYRKSRNEGLRFGDYVAAVLSLRRWVFFGAAAPVLIGFVVAAKVRGFATAAAGLAAVGIIAAVGLQIAASVRLVVLRLRDRLNRSYAVELGGEGSRLAGVGVMVATSTLFGWLGVAVSALGSAVTVLAAGNAAAGETRRADTLGAHRRQVVRYLLPTLPSALYYSIQGPLVVWLAATFGGTRNIAEVGALGRLGLIVGVFSSLTGIVFIPRLANITDDRLYLRRFLQFGAALAAIAAAMLTAAWLVPDLFLLLLGPNYKGLHTELLLIVATAGATLLGGYLVAVNLARAWTRLQGAAVGVLALVQVVLVSVLPLDRTVGVLAFGAATACTGLALQAAMTITGFKRPTLVLIKEGR